MRERGGQPTVNQNATESKARAPGRYPLGGSVFLDVTSCLASSSEGAVVECTAARRAWTCLPALSLVPRCTSPKGASCHDRVQEPILVGASDWWSGSVG